MKKRLRFLMEELFVILILLFSISICFFGLFYSKSISLLSLILLSLNTSIMLVMLKDSIKSIINLYK